MESRTQYRDANRLYSALFFALLLAHHLLAPVWAASSRPWLVVDYGKKPLPTWVKHSANPKQVHRGGATPKKLMTKLPTPSTPRTAARFSQPAPQATMAAVQATRMKKEQLLSQAAQTQALSSKQLWQDGALITEPAAVTASHPTVQSITPAYVALTKAPASPKPQRLLSESQSAPTLLYHGQARVQNAPRPKQASTQAQYLRAWDDDPTEAQLIAEEDTILLQLPESVRDKVLAQPEHPRAQLAMAEAHAQQQDVGAALTGYAGVIGTALTAAEDAPDGLSPDTWVVALHRWLALMQQAGYSVPDCRAQLSQWLAALPQGQASPYAAELLSLRGYLAFTHGDETAAKEDAQASIALVPQQVTGWWVLGQCAEWQGNLPEALKAYQTALQHAQQPTETHATLQQVSPVWASMATDLPQGQQRVQDRLSMTPLQ